VLVLHLILILRGQWSHIAPAVGAIWLVETSTDNVESGNGWVFGLASARDSVFEAVHPVLGNEQNQIVAIKCNDSDR
jgi:hypothetical protein